MHHAEVPVTVALPSQLTWGDWEMVNYYGRTPGALMLQPTKDDLRRRIRKLERELREEIARRENLEGQLIGLLVSVGAIAKPRKRRA